VVASVSESVPTVWQRLGTQLHGRRSAWSAAAAVAGRDAMGDPVAPGVGGDA
jgi:hypothetical protein